MTLGITRSIQIKNHRVILNGIVELTLSERSVGPFFRSLYRHYQINYPKFFKMDNLSQLCFLSAEILLQGTEFLRNTPGEEIGIILGNASSSWESDEKHQESIRDRGDYFPSPSVFVYTLPNIMAGEIAIRHKIKGENTVFIFEQFDPGFWVEYVSELFQNQRVKGCLCGWVEWQRDYYESFLFVVEPKDHLKRPEKGGHWLVFDRLNLGKLFKGSLLL
ncbi:MAG: 3-oxoacyl-ACP synthase [Pseudomonadota bacterium]